MKVIKKAAEMQNSAKKLERSGKSVGFVPTMGALHAGHITLVKRSIKDNDITVVSIFVNPTQFGPKEDLSKYPRTFNADEKLLKAAGADYVYYPTADEMYPKGHQTFVDLETLPVFLCGTKRPGHFRGVATVVTKLLNIVRPTTAYFGQKDYQQSAIIRRMVTDLNMPVEIKVMPIVREKDGLAMSSRNRYLDEKQRKDAAVLYRSIKRAGQMVSEGNTLSEKIIMEMWEMILKQAPYAVVDYIEIVDPSTLEKAETVKGKAVVALAVFFGSTRLIDNAVLKTK